MAPIILDCGTQKDVEITGDLKVWHPVTFTFNGKETGETASPNPFTDYRLTVEFEGPSGKYIVPGYYAADGNAAGTGADTGNKWRVHFTPEAEGSWEYQVSFRTGSGIAIDPDPQAGKPVSFDGKRGSCLIGPSDKSGRDFRGRGMLRYIGEHYLQFAGSKEYFLKAGADSPENFLAYRDFDGTEDREAITRAGEARAVGFLHSYAPHVSDWHQGDPTWRNGKGKGIIGALNYLAGKGMNSVYFLTMNVDGDGNDVWPWIEPNVHDRFDCSKLDQWNIVFSHMDNLGIMLHVVHQETENDQLLDEGNLGPERKLYYRELISRFGHHLGLIWNLGEENTNTNEQRKDFCQFIREIDPYDHPIVVHTFPGRWDQVYGPLVGFSSFEGPSLQDGEKLFMHREVKKWIDSSAVAGRKWVVMQDEQSPNTHGAKPDTADYWHDHLRHHYLWSSLMAGAAGIEWYFGYLWGNNDLNCEDWRSREHLWDMTRLAVECFTSYLPFTEMHHADELTSDPDDFCFAKRGEVYAIYIPNGAATVLDLEQFGGTFSVFWFNPRTGGALQKGNLFIISGPGKQKIGNPPEDQSEDWVAIIRRNS